MRGAFRVPAPDAIRRPPRRIYSSTLIRTFWISAIVTLYTGYDYFRAGLKHIAVTWPWLGPGEAVSAPATR